MATRQPPGQPPTGAVPPAVMEEYLKLTQKQQERRDSFELRAANVRRHFAELDANEHHRFWTSYSSHVSQVGGGSNGHNVHVNQAGANIPSRPQKVPQRADNPPLPPPSQSQRKKPAQPAAQQKTKPVPVLVPKKPPHARRSANAASPASRPVPGQSAAHIQPKATTKAQPKSDAKAGKNSGSRQQQPEVIDLCSDEDHEPQPQPSAQSNTAVRAPGQQVEFNPPLPNGVLSFFGNDSKMVRPDSKTEEDRNSRPTPTSSVAPNLLNLPSSNAQLTSYGLPPSFITKQTGSNAMRLGTTTFSPVQMNDPVLPDRQSQPSESEVRVHPDNSPNLRGQQTFIPQEPLSRSSLPRQIGHFVNEDLQKGRAQRLSNNGKCPRPQQDCSTGVEAKDLSEQSQPDILPPEEELAQGFPSSTGLPSQQGAKGSVGPTQFKVPKVPSRAAATPESTRREGTVISQASSQPMPPNRGVGADNTRHDRLPLPTPPLSQVPSTRKRKIEHNVSDGSDNVSEFEPSSDDDIPSSRRQKKPALKKAKSIHCSGTARPASGVSKFGFKPKKPLMRNRDTAPAHLNRKPAVPSTPATSTSSKSSKRALRSESPSVRAAMRSSVRRAKQEARAALDIHFQREFEFHAEEDIREADEREHRLKSTLPMTAEPELRDELRRMSITPAPSARPSLGHTQTDGAKDGGDDTVQSKGDGSAYGLGRWTQDRMRGDRYLTQSQASSSRGRGDEESDSELDLSAYQYVNGRIVGRVKEMDLTENS